ncbi:MAG: hypothetical protein NTY53_23090 [Kiritimatiellaeota bacterium]|nr:hypothetical protein [Kiritimatiellota bacterium]
MIYHRLLHDIGEARLGVRPLIGTAKRGVRPLAGARDLRSSRSLTRLTWRWLALFVAIASAGGAIIGQAQENKACLECHGDTNLVTQRDGVTIPLCVTASNFEASVHGTLACVLCHADLKNKELPHDTPLAKVVCAACHERLHQLNAGSRHGQALARGDPLAPRCQDCHGAHDIVPVHDPQSAVAPLKIRARRSSGCARSIRIIFSKITPKAFTARVCSKRA